MIVCGDQFTGILHAEIDPSQLPRAMGGSLPDPW